MNRDKGKGIDTHDSSGSDNEKDEPSHREDGYAEYCSEANGDTRIPWQRMKWTNDIIRLLISITASIEEDGLGDGIKSKYGCLHKKGKWKMISKNMISKGCHVSPQQCEDKFNDLNKRYKKLIDILGRESSCRVVENPSLLDSIPHLSAKEKDEVKKILNSKHLFYIEMCAYHNGQKLSDCHFLNHSGSALTPINGCSREIHMVDDYDDDDDDSDDDDDEKDSSDERNDKDIDNDGSRASPQLFGLDGFRTQMSKILRDPTKSSLERREWIKKQKLDLHKQRMSLQARAFKIEKQRIKWVTYCVKKDEELEGLRMEKEMMRIENEQHILRLKQKGLEVGWRRPKGCLYCTYSGSGNILQ